MHPFSLARGKLQLASKTTNNYRYHNHPTSTNNRISELSDWALCRTHPLFVHCSTHDHELCRLTLRSFIPKECVAWHSKVASDGHDRVLKANRQVHISRFPSDSTSKDGCFMNAHYLPGSHNTNIWKRCYFFDNSNAMENSD